MIFIYLPGGHPRVFGRLRVFVGAVIETFRSTTENKVRKLAPPWLSQDIDGNRQGPGMSG